MSNVEQESCPWLVVMSWQMLLWRLGRLGLQLAKLDMGGLATGRGWGTKPAQLATHQEWSLTAKPQVFSTKPLLFFSRIAIG